MLLALGGLWSGVGSDPVREVDCEADRASKDCVNRTRLLRLNEEGACDDRPEVVDVRWARGTSSQRSMNDRIL